MDERVRALNDQPVRRGGGYVLYWCRWNRRVESNHALLYAAEMANRMNLPLVCFERLSCAYPTASDRFHTFVLEGVPEMQAAVHKLGAGYIFQLPRRKTTSDARLRAVIRGRRRRGDRRLPARHSHPRRAVARGRFQLHRAHEQDSRAQLRRLFDPPQNPPHAARVPASRSHGRTAPALPRRLSAICTPRSPPAMSRTWWRRARSTTAYAPPPAFRGGRTAAEETLAALPRRPVAPLRARQERALGPRHQRSQPLPALRPHLVARSGAGRQRACRPSTS